MNRLMYKQVVGDSGFKTADNWNESDHPRSENGQFGAGGGGKKSTGREHQGPSEAAFNEQENRRRDDAIRWANKEKDQYGTAWMKENLPDYLVERWGVTKEFAKKKVNEWFE